MTGRLFHYLPKSQGKHLISWMRYHLVLFSWPRVLFVLDVQYCKVYFVLFQIVCFCRFCMCSSSFSYRHLASILVGHCQKASKNPNNQLSQVTSIDPHSFLKFVFVAFHWIKALENACFTHHLSIARLFVFMGIKNKRLCWKGMDGSMFLLENVFSSSQESEVIWFLLSFFSNNSSLPS